MRLGRSRIIAMIMATVACAALNGCRGSDDKPGTSLDHVTYITAFGAAGRDAFAGSRRKRAISVRPGSTCGSVRQGGRREPQGHGLRTGAVREPGPHRRDDLRGCRAGQGIQGLPRHPRHSPADPGLHHELEGAGITTPKDLEGKKIAAAANSVNQLLFPGYARLAGIEAAGSAGSPCSRSSWEAPWPAARSTR